MEFVVIIHWKKLFSNDRVKVPDTFTPDYGKANMVPSILKVNIILKTRKDSIWKITREKRL